MTVSLGKPDFSCTKAMSKPTTMPKAIMMRHDPLPEALVARSQNQAKEQAERRPRETNSVPAHR